MNAKKEEEFKDQCQAMCIDIREFQRESIVHRRSNDAHESLHNALNL